MAGVPAHCQSCGALFVSNLISIGGGSKDITLIGNMVSCPFCGNMSRVTDGTYNAVGDVLELVSGPDTTADMLRRLYAITKSAYYGETSLDEAESQATAIKPEFGQAINIIKKRGSINKMLLLALMVAALAYCQPDVKLDMKLDLNRLINQIIGKEPNAIIERLENDLEKDRSRPAAPDGGPNLRKT